MKLILMLMFGLFLLLAKTWNPDEVAHLGATDGTHQGPSQGDGEGEWGFGIRLCITSHPALSTPPLSITTSLTWVWE